MSSNSLQQRSTGGNSNKNSSSHAASSYSNVALSPPSISTHPTATTPVSTTLQSPPCVTNTTTTIRQRRMTHAINNDKAASSSSSSSISELCTDTYQCMCLLPVYPNYKHEYLEYNYHNSVTSNGTTTPELPPSSSTKVRIRNRGEYYLDSYNDQSKSFTFGTNENVRCSLFFIVDLVRSFVLCTRLWWNHHLIRDDFFLLPPSHQFSLFLSFRMVYGAIPVIKPEPSCPHWSGAYYSIPPPPSRH